MMKLVISFDEIGLDNGFEKFSPIKTANDLQNFLEDQFPEWDMEEVFYIPEFDFENMEVTLEMRTI